VAEGLAREFAASPAIELAWIWSRDPLRGGELATLTGTEWRSLPEAAAPKPPIPADLYVLAVSDPAVAGLSASLPLPPDCVVAHTAGCVALTELSPRIIHRAVIYPLQSFTRGRPVPDFRSTPFFIEGETPHALATVRAAAGAISDSVTELSSGRRARLHLAGAFANNFSNAMLSLAEEIARDAGLDFDALRPIVRETFGKALSMPSPRLAQTGAAQRGDRTIQARHLAILAATRPELTRLYEEISELIWKISKRN
jgi:predicted short-subunit dehydrogenase-like oxidoreductase (DUF2520 family)